MQIKWFGAAERDELRRGWRPLLACAIGVAFGAPLYVYLSSLFAGPLVQAFGWSRAALGGVLLAISTSALFMPVVAMLIDRYGVRRSVAVSVVGASLAYGLLASMTGAVWQYYAAYAVVAVLGAAAGPIAYGRVVISWFEHARGLALALMLSGAAIGGMIASPLVSAVINNFGFRAGYGALGVLCVLGGLAALALGLKPGPLVQAERSADGRRTASFTPWRAVLTRPAFWLLAGAIFTMTLGAVGLVAHLQPIFVNRGMPPSTAAWLVSLLAISVLLGRVLTGLLIDRFWAPGVAAAVCVTAASGAALLLWGGSSVSVSVIGILLFGTAQGAELDLLCFLVARYFGLQAYSRVYGALFICFGIALPVGAVSFGAIFDRMGSYGPALATSALLLVASGVLYLLLGPYPRKAAAGGPAEASPDTSPNASPTAPTTNKALAA